MVNKKYVPDAGDLIWINFNPTKGHEQNNLRPALVLSPKLYNKKTSLVVLCPVTTKGKGYPFEVPFQNKRITGVVLADQLHTVDWNARPVKFICKTHAEVLQLVQKKIQKLIL